MLSGRGLVETLGLVGRCVLVEGSVEGSGLVVSTFTSGVVSLNSVVTSGVVVVGRSSTVVPLSLVTLLVGVVVTEASSVVAAATVVCFDPCVVPAGESVETVTSPKIIKYRREMTFEDIHLL